MDIPEVLALLTQHGIRQADLVQRLRVSKSLVSMWFSGEKPITPSRLPDLWELAALARDARAVRVPRARCPGALASDYPRQQAAIWREDVHLYLERVRSFRPVAPFSDLRGLPPLLACAESRASSRSAGQTASRSTRMLQPSQNFGLG